MIFKYDFFWPDNKYTRRYLKLIDLSLAGQWSNYEGYTEKHHIVPKSFGGGNGKANIAVLPGKFHYHAHYWLMKAFPLDSKQGRSMIAAFRKMNLSRSYQDRPYNRTLYEEMRSRAAIAGTGRKMSDENKAKLSAARKGVIVSDETRKKLSAARRGKPLSDEHKNAISAGAKGRKDTDEVKERRAAHHRGAKRSEETKARMREGRRLARERRAAEHQTTTGAFSTPAVPNTRR